VKSGRNVCGGRVFTRRALLEAIRNEAFGFLRARTYGRQVHYDDGVMPGLCARKRRRVRVAGAPARTRTRRPFRVLRRRRPMGFSCFFCFLLIFFFETTRRAKIPLEPPTDIEYHRLRRRSSRAFSGQLRDRFLFLFCF